MDVAQALERFTFASWRAMIAKDGVSDKIYSPYSAFVAFLMTAIISKGETKEEILRALQFGSDEDPEELLRAWRMELDTDESAWAKVETELPNGTTRIEWVHKEDTV